MDGGGQQDLPAGGHNGLPGDVHLITERVEARSQACLQASAIPVVRCAVHSSMRTVQSSSPRDPWCEEATRAIAGFGQHSRWWARVSASSSPNGFLVEDCLGDKGIDRGDGRLAPYPRLAAEFEGEDLLGGAGGEQPGSSGSGSGRRGRWRGPSCRRCRGAGRRGRRRSRRRPSRRRPGPCAWSTGRGGSAGGAVDAMHARAPAARSSSTALPARNSRLASVRGLTVAVVEEHLGDRAVLVGGG